jgi:DNA-binding NtrC family response regulator
MADEQTGLSAERELAGAEVLVVDGDAAVPRGLEKLLAPRGLPLTTATAHERALELVTTKVFGVVVIDLDTPGPNAGLQLVEEVRLRSPTSLILVLAARKSFDAAVAAFRSGANDVVWKAPDQVDYLIARIIDAAGDWVTRGKTRDLLVEIRGSLEEFLRRFMETERRATDLQDQLAGRGADRTDVDDDVRMLFVDSDDRLYKALARPGQRMGFTLAQSGGEALDHVTKGEHHIALVGPTLPDLPSSLVIKTLLAQAPGTTVISYEPNGRLEIVEPGRVIPIVPRFTAAAQLADRLAELAEAHRAKMRERRYLAAFRERHYEFLRQLSELRKKIERAIEDEGDTFKFGASGAGTPES